MNTLHGILFNVLTTEPKTSASLVDEVRDYCRTHMNYSVNGRGYAIKGYEAVDFISDLSPLDIQQAVKAMRSDIRFDVEIVSSSNGYALRKDGDTSLSFEAKHAIGGVIHAVKTGALSKRYLYKILHVLDDFPVSKGQVNWADEVYRRVVKEGGGSDA